MKPTGPTVAEAGSAIDAVVVVGASLAGLRTVSALRRQGFAGRITLVGAEPHRPYHRPPLSKAYLAGQEDDDDIAVCDDDALAALHADVVLGTAATALDLRAREIGLADGRTLAFDRLVVATGARPLVPAIFAGSANVSALRTVEDSLLLRERVLAADRIAVIGGGFVGAEIASTVRGMGVGITLVEALQQPMERVLGAEIGAVLAARHRAAGVDLRTGAAVTGVARVPDVPGSNGSAAGARISALTLEDGTSVPVDHVVVAVGVRPELDWLDGNGLDLTDGVRCDDAGCASGSGGVVYALGDVASWYYARYAEQLRVEHWTNAVDAAPIVAQALLGGSRDDAHALGLPFFWSDQCGAKIQALGRPAGAAEARLVKGTVDAGRFVAAYRRRDTLAGVVAFGSPRELVRARTLLEANATWDEALTAWTA